MPPDDRLTDRVRLGTWATKEFTWLGANTTYRGDWQAPQGSDLALRIMDGVGERVHACSQHDEPSPAPTQAAESAGASFWTMVFGEATDEVLAQVWVGTAGSCASNAAVVNATPVPYRLDVWLSSDRFSAPALPAPGTPSP